MTTGGGSSEFQGSGRSRRRKGFLLLVATLAVAAAGCLAAAAYFLVAPGIEDYARRTEFSADRWRSGSPDDNPMWPTRLRMVDDLIAGKRLDGLTHGQVEALLGPGDHTAKWREWQLVYYLGPERSGFFRIDSEWLVVRFDSSDRVAEYRVLRD